MNAKLQISKRAPAALLAAGAAGLLYANQLFASDRGDVQTPRDTQADIVDLYTFVAPVVADSPTESFMASQHMVLAMTVRPEAPAGTNFASDVEYLFRIRPSTTGASGDLQPDSTLACRFTAENATSGAQDFFCNINGFFFAGVTNQTSGAPDAPLRVFAGRRRDPSAGPADRIARLATGGALPTSAEANPYVSSSALAIVAELDMSKILFSQIASGPLPLLAISAETSR